MSKTMQLKKKDIDMLHGPLGRNIFLFAIPLAFTGILQQLFNAADVAVVGRFVGKNAMAAVGSNSPIIGLLVNLFVGIALGANVVIARFTGMENWKNVRKAVDVSIIIALVCGIFAAILGESLATPVLKLVSVPTEVFNMSETYLRIYLVGLPVILLYNFESAIFRSQGDSVTPLICLAISGVVNVILNLVFVILLDMAAGGVALATVIANVVSSSILFWKLTHSDTPISIHKHKLEIDFSLVKMIFIIGLPAGIQSAMFSISNICIQSAINALGADVMAASSAAFNLEIIVYYIVNSFGQATTTFTGQNYGAGNVKRCRKVLLNSIIQDCILTGIVCSLMLIFGRHILGIFNKDTTVLNYGCIRIRYILTGELLNILIEVFSGAMRGYGYSLVPALIALFGICGVSILWINTIFNAHKSLGVLLLCYPISWAITVAILITAYIIKIRKIDKKEILT